MSGTGPTSTPPEPGAPAAPGAVPLSVPEILGNEWDYIKECLDTNWVSSAGPFVDRFEKELTAYLGADYGVATSSGTGALHIALLVAGVEPDDEVLVSTLTFIAPANAIRYAGAYPVFIDADPDYWQMDPEILRDFAETQCHWENGRLINKVSGRRIKAILPVHILGHPCDMDPILEMARQYDLAVVEDATESLGANYKDRRVGLLGDISCFSFNGNKLITTGGGGMVVTDNEEWAHRAQYLTTQAKDDPVEYVHGEIGYNYRLTNIQAAMGCAQLERLEEFLAAKQSIASIYRDRLVEIPGITTMPEAPWADSAFWLNTVMIDPEVYGASSRDVLRRMDVCGIQTRPLWQPIHLSGAHRDSYCHGCGVAERLVEQGLSLPSSVGLTPQEQGRVIDVLLHADAKDETGGSGR